MHTESLRAFVEVVRKRSFAAVAQDLAVTPSTISRTIAALERELGVRLLHRTTRRLAPTEAGLVYFERLAPLVDELENARLIARDTGEQPAGTLRVTAPVTFAQLNLLPLLPAFAARYPKLGFDLLLTDSMIDLVAERFDVAVRLGRLPDSTLIAHRLCDMHYVVCASPGYFARRGKPKTPRDLASHDCLRYSVLGQRPVWRFRDRAARVEEIAVQGRFTMSNGVALRQCAMDGLGVMLTPRWNVARELADGSLVAALTSYECTGSEFGAAAWALYPSREYVPLKVRVFVDLLRSAFAKGAPNEIAALRGPRSRRLSGRGS